MYECSVCMYAYMPIYHLHAVPQNAWRGHHITQNCTYNGCEPLCGFWEMNLGILRHSAISLVPVYILSNNNLNHWDKSYIHHGYLPPNTWKCMGVSLCSHTVISSVNVHWCHSYDVFCWLICIFSQDSIQSRADTVLHSFPLPHFNQKQFNSLYVNIEHC